MKKINGKTKRSVSEYCSDYINNFNAHALSKSWRSRAIKAAAIAGVSSAFIASNNVEAQTFDCPPVFDLIQNQGSVTNPSGLTTTTYRTNPVFVDFDGDGLIDVVSGSGGVPGGDEIRFFKNIGTNTNPVWDAPVVAPNGLSGADLFTNFGVSNFAPSFVDVDGDGDLDAFIADFNRGFFYQENIGTATAPNYSAAVLNPFGITVPAAPAILFGPTFVDIDGDGDQDLFAGEVYNDILYFENTGTATAPAFAAPLTNQFGLDNTFQVDYLPKLAFADLDNDGDQDAMLGTFYGNFNYFENTGNATTPSFGAAQVNPFFLQAVDQRNTASFADVDNDGDLDLISGANNPGDYIYYQNFGTPTTPAFGDFAFDLQMPLADNTNNVDYADMDADGDLDLILGDNNGDVFFVENTSPNATDITFAAPAFMFNAPAGYAHPTLADLNSDGLVDIVVGDYDGDLLFYENTGTPAAFAFGAPVVNGLGLSNADVYATPQFADVDGDGDQDLFVGNKGAGGITYFENNPVGGVAAFSVAPAPGGLAAVGDFAVSLSDVDLDGDGDLDFVYSTDTDISSFINTGTTTAPNFVDTGDDLGIDFQAVAPPAANPHYPLVVDINQDGFFEAFVGAKNSDGLAIYKDVKVIPNIAIVETSPLLSCEANTLSISSTNVGVGDLTVTWYDGNNNVVGTGATITLPSLDSDTYSAKAVVTATGCESNQPTINVVRQNPVISITQGSQIFSCETNTLSVASSNFALSDLTIRWFDSNNNQVATGDTFTLSSLSTETYSVVATSPTGCDSNQPTVNVIQNLPAISVAEGSTVNACTVTTLHAASSNFALADLTFEWRAPNNDLVGTGATLSTASLAPQTYTLKATSVTGCESTITVDVVRTLPILSIAEGPSMNSCAGNTISVLSSNYSLSDLTFEWLVNGNVVGTGTTYTLQTTTSQRYTVRATTPNGCQSTTYIDAIEDVPNISVPEGTSIFSCEPVTLNVESSDYLLSDLNFTWLDSDGNSIGTGTSISVDPLALPNYGPKTVTVSATSPQGCVSNVVSVTVACSDEVAINLSATAGYSTANLTWTTTGTRPVREYEVYGDPGQLGTYFLFGYSSVNSYEAVGLTNGQKVDFKVRPIYVDGDYGTYSNVATVKPSIVLGEEDNEKAGFAFFPNPNNGEFNLRLQDGSTAASVSVVSLSGQEVFTTTLSSSQTSINLGNVASGMYIVRVKTEQGIYQQKVSVVR